MQLVNVAGLERVPLVHPANGCSSYIPLGGCYSRERRGRFLELESRFIMLKVRARMDD